jgi:hypothetical protein
MSQTFRMKGIVRLAKPNSIFQQRKYRMPYILDYGTPPRPLTVDVERIYNEKQNNRQGYLKDLLTKQNIEPNPGPKNGNMSIKKKQPTKKKPQGKLVKPNTQTSQNPAEMVIPIPFESSSRNFNNAGFAFAQTNFNANNMYDKQGTILTNNAVRINSYFDRYGVYLVTATKIVAKFTNLEQFGVEIIYTPTLIQPLASATYDDAIAASWGPSNKRIVVAEQYGKLQHEITKKMNWGTFYGNRDAYVGSELFSGNAFSGPTNTVFHNFTILAPRNLTVGVDFVFVEISYVRFYLNVPATATSFRINPKTGRPEIPSHYLDIVRKHLSKEPTLRSLALELGHTSTLNVEDIKDKIDSMTKQELRDHLQQLL